MSARLALIAGASLALGACATPGQRVEAPRVDLSGACASSLGELPLNAVSLTDKDAASKPRQFAAVAGCLRDDSGRRPVARFDLSAATPPYAIKVSLAAGNGGALAARVLVIDEQRAVLQRHGFHEFIARGSDYTLTFFINPADGHARELLIEPDVEHVGRKIEQVSGQQLFVPIVTPVAVGGWVDGVERHGEVALGDAGAVTVRVSPYRAEILETKR